MYPLVAPKTLATGNTALVTLLVNAPAASSPVAIVMPVAEMSVNVPGMLVTVLNCATAVDDTAMPATAASPKAERILIAHHSWVVKRRAVLQYGREPPH